MARSRKSSRAQTLRVQIIERARELGLNAQALADETDGVVSVAQMYRYFAAESDLTGEKLDAVLKVLGLAVSPRRPGRPKS